MNTENKRSIVELPNFYGVLLLFLAMLTILVVIGIVFNIRVDLEVWITAGCLTNCIGFMILSQPIPKMMTRGEFAFRILSSMVVVVVFAFIMYSYGDSEITTFIPITVGTILFVCTTSITVIVLTKRSNALHNTGYVAFGNSEGNEP